MDFCQVDLALPEPEHDHSVHIEAVNSNPESTWIAGHNDRFNGMTLSEIKSMMGTVVDPEWRITLRERQFDVNVSVPASFDVVENWPDCASVSGHIRDQANCGSCWAHGTTEALNDRRCIKMGGSYTTLLSVADTTACCNLFACFSQGCNGGQVGTPWGWFERKGVVDGGDFGDSTTCYPYTMPECNHHVENPAHKSCSDIPEVDPKCDKDCPGNSANYENSKVKGTSSYSVGSVEKIKEDLVAYGSVTAAFTVYEDFLTYKSGVYTHQSGSALGGHAVKIVGYGTENGQDYWRVANSWNPDWGDKGYFKIAQDSCGISDQCHAGQA